MVNRHALPVVTPAIAAMTGVNISTMLINVAVIEYGFGIPGLFSAIHARLDVTGDVPVLMGLVIEGVLLIMIANFIADAVSRCSTRKSGCKPERGQHDAPDVLGAAVQRDGADRVPAEAVLAADARGQQADRDLVHQLDQRPRVHRHRRAGARCRPPARARRP